MNFGEKITQIRKKYKLTQEELAEKLYVSRQTVSNWENCKCYPDIETIILISELFNVSLDELIKNDDKMVKIIDKKIRTNKYLKRLLMFSFIILFVVSINVFHKNYVIKLERRRNDELKQELIKYTEVGENKTVYSINVTNLDNANYSLSSKYVDIYVDNNIVSSDVKVISMKNDKGNKATDNNSISYILIEVSDEEYAHLIKAEVNNKKIIVKDSSL